jgi:hypothetical protein
MPHGIITYVGPQRKANITPNGFGGVFVETYTFGVNYARRTFTNLAGMSIFHVVVKGGYHTIVKGIDGNGYPYIEAAGYPIPTWQVFPANTFDTQIAIFAK